MTPSLSFLDLCLQISFMLLSLSLILISFRIVLGPTLPDRVLALDMLVAVGIGFIALIGIATRYFLYIDVAIALSLMGFLATVAFARFIKTRGSTLQEHSLPQEEEREESQ